MPFYEYECSNCKFYVEVLQKISDEPLRDCPSYQQRASLANGAAAGERHLLNCGPVAAIGPGQQVVFAMVLDLPATLRPGKGALVWQLLRQAPPGTKVLVTVVGP